MKLSLHSSWPQRISFWKKKADCRFDSIILLKESLPIALKSEKSETFDPFIHSVLIGISTGIFAIYEQ